MQHLYQEILHWLHQRGDTVGATRLLSTKRWNSLRSQKFEQPIVFYVGKPSCGFGIHAEAIDIGIWTKHVGDLVIIPAGRVRIYEKYSLVITNNISRFPTIGDTDNIDCIFLGNRTFNQPLVWDTKNIKSAVYAFESTEYFNQPLHWNMSKLENASYMFNRAHSFNQSLNWDTNCIQYTIYTFSRTYSFNKPLYFNTRNLLSSHHMFYAAKQFDQPLQWNTINLEDAGHMFCFADSFNQHLGWNTMNLQCACFMFYFAESFSKCLKWNTKNVLEKTNMFLGSKGSLKQYLYFFLHKTL